MQITNLMAIQEDGQKLVMMDGTIWIINPDDIKKTKIVNTGINFLI